MTFHDPAHVACLVEMRSLRRVQLSFMPPSFDGFVDFSSVGFTDEAATHLRELVARRVEFELYAHEPWTEAAEEIFEGAVVLRAGGRIGVTANADADSLLSDIRWMRFLGARPDSSVTSTVSQPF